MGPMETSAVSGKYRYSFVITDNYSCYAWTAHLVSKDQTAAKFKAWVSMIENQLGRRVGYFRSDRGGEFMSAEFSAILEEHGITCETSAPYTPQQNGVAERVNRTLMEMARPMLINANCPDSYWAEAVKLACWLYNRIKRQGTLPAVWKWDRTRPDLSLVHTFGWTAWAKVLPVGSKLADRGKRLMFVGFSHGSKGWRLMDPADNNRVIDSRDVVFDDDTPYFATPQDSATTIELPRPNHHRYESHRNPNFPARTTAS